MKCPNDQSEMEEGYVNMGNWVRGELPFTLKPFLKNNDTKPVIAWRCPRCGRIELVTKVEEEK